MDVLTDVLNTLELKGWLSSRRELAPYWRYDFATSKDCVFHIFRFGGCYLCVEGEPEPVRLEDGDVILFPTGHPHSLYDPSISTALGLIHQSPERSWKVEELAEAVGLSRSMFSARFTQLVGEPPMKYLTLWRMHRAMRLLKHEVNTETVAELLGYESEVAFRKAFKREVGTPPAA